MAAFGVMVEGCHDRATVLNTPEHGQQVYGGYWGNGAGAQVGEKVFFEEAQHAGTMTF